jgi:hypothetical protein
MLPLRLTLNSKFGVSRGSAFRPTIFHRGTYIVFLLPLTLLAALSSTVSNGKWHLHSRFLVSFNDPKARQWHRLAMTMTMNQPMIFFLSCLLCLIVVCQSLMCFVIFKNAFRFFTITSPNIGLSFSISSSSSSVSPAAECLQIRFGFWKRINVKANL